LVTVINLLQVQGASIKFHSNDWKTFGIVGSVSNLQGVGGLTVTDKTWQQWKETGEAEVIIGEGLGVVGIEPLAGIFILGGAATWGIGSVMEWMSDDEAGLPQTTTGDLPETGDDTGVPGGVGDDNVLVIPAITITGTFTGVDNPSALPDAPPLDIGEIPDIPPDSGGAGDTGGGGAGDTGGGGGGGG
jgi:hypothetical protein